MFDQLDHHFPPKFESSENEPNGQISDAFLLWEQQDHLLLSWLLEYMSDAVLMRVGG